MEEGVCLKIESKVHWLLQQVNLIVVGKWIKVKHQAKKRKNATGKCFVKMVFNNYLFTFVLFNCNSKCEFNSAIEFTF